MTTANEKINKFDKNSLVERFVSLAPYLSLTRKDFADLCDVSEGTIRNIKAGLSAPNAKILWAISQKTNISINWLLTGKGEMIQQEESTEYQKKELNPKESLLDKTVAILKEHGANDEEIRQAVHAIIGSNMGADESVSMVKQTG